jgi:hypothetical protein
MEFLGKYSILIKCLFTPNFGNTYKKIFINHSLQTDDFLVSPAKKGKKTCPIKQVFLPFSALKLLMNFAM